MKTRNDIQMTVAIPTRNRARYLFYALESCRQQPSLKFQFIVIDNNSSDDTRAVCEHFSADPRFKYCFFDETGNINDQFQRCLENADGDWLTIIGDDDCIFSDFSALLEVAILGADSAAVNAISWDPCIYRWDSFSGVEKNRFKFFGLDNRFDFNGDQMIMRNPSSFHTHLKHNLKLIYQGPGVYHKACRRSALQTLCDRQGYQSVFYHSPDISVSAHLIGAGEVTLHARQSFTVLGYSENSTGASHSAGSNPKALERYYVENPEALPDYFQLLGIDAEPYTSGFTMSEIGVTFLILSTVFGSYACNPPSIQQYILSEISNSSKLAPAHRPGIKSVLLNLIKKHGLNHSDYELALFDSTDSPISLPPPDPATLYEKTGITSNGKELLRIERTIDGAAMQVHSILDAAAFAHAQFRFGLT